MNKPICEGCNGSGITPVRIQTEGKSGRQCFMSTMTCLVCKGSGSSTAEELEEFFKQMESK